VLMVAGGVVLVIEQGALGQVQLWGLLAVMLATVAWGVDNTLSRGVASRDPGQVVLVKSALGAMCTGALACLFGESTPLAVTAIGLVIIGATGYGLSLRFYLLAQRIFGAARTGSVFAFAPFIGAVGAFALGDRSGSALMVMAGALMMLGVLLHLMEAHAHEHTHDPLEHEHSHRHDDGHHDHMHELMPTVRHNHRHKHEPVTHSHAHVPDAHHGHSH
jgi:drug/metabolite transporter (DMT)-like permease